MKKILTILILLITVFSYSQNLQLDNYTFDNKTENVYDYTNNIELSNSLRYLKTTDNSILGPGLILGGATFILVGVLTGTNLVGGTSQNAIYDLNKYLAIGTGSILLVTGIALTISIAL